jgi:hypothetical protein
VAFVKKTPAEFVLISKEGLTIKASSPTVPPIGTTYRYGIGTSFISSATRSGMNRVDVFTVFVPV